MSKKTIINIFVCIVWLLLAFCGLKYKEMQCQRKAEMQGYDAVYDYINNMCFIEKDGRLIDYNKFIEQR